VGCARTRHRQLQNAAEHRQRHTRGSQSSPIGLQADKRRNVPQPSQSSRLFSQGINVSVLVSALAVIVSPPSLAKTAVLNSIQPIRLSPFVSSELINVAFGVCPPLSTVRPVTTSSLLKYPSLFVSEARKAVSGGTVAGSTRSGPWGAATLSALVLSCADPCGGGDGAVELACASTHSGLVLPLSRHH
jgi:hypothetical protein